MVSCKKILSPTDFSEPSYEALKAANGMALRYSSKLYVVNVVPPLPDISIPTEGGTRYDISWYEKELISSAEQSLHAVIKKRISKKLQVYPVVLQGDPADEIVKFATEKKMDMIVIATHGRTGWSHLVFGSVAEKVIRLTPCPVLVVRVHGE